MSETDAPAIAGLDHVLVGVRDLAGARDAWQRLGFRLSPRGRHIGWGTANYCIMFPDDYIELLGIVDPSKFTNNLDRFLERREGLLGLALASGDAAAAARALHGAGIDAQAPTDLRRILELPDGEVTPAFRLVHLPNEATAGLSAFVCHHLSRDLVWQADWLDHPNGARGIDVLEAAVDDPQQAGALWCRLPGVRPAASGAGRGVDVRCGQAILRFVGSAGQAEPQLTTLAVRVADIAAAAACLDASGVPYRDAAPGVLRVAPAHASGVIVEFREAASTKGHRR